MIPKADGKILDRLKEQAESFIQLTEKKFHIKPDYSEESLALIDDLITIFFKYHKEHYITAAIFIGSYLGETIIKNLGGKWLKDFSIKKVGKIKGFAHPITRAKKRLANGTEDSLVRYYRNLKLSNCRDSDFAPNKEKLKDYYETLLKYGWHKELYNRVIDKSNHRYIREEAAELLGRLVNDDINSQLMELAADSQLVYYGAIALQGHPVKEAWKPLLESLKNPHLVSREKQQILLALGKIGAKEALSDMIPFLNDPDEIVGHYAALSIGKIGGDEAVDKLLAIMGDLYPGNKLHAITAMEIIADKRTVPALIEALFSRDEELREAAARALQYIPEQSSFKPLLYCLNDRSSRIRIYAAYALANIGSPEAEVHIKKLLTDDVQTVRLHASHLLRWIQKGEKPAAKVI